MVFAVFVEDEETRVSWRMGCMQRSLEEIVHFDIAAGSTGMG